jgi:hypothetical protein
MNKDKNNLPNTDKNSWYKAFQPKPHRKEFMDKDSSIFRLQSSSEFFNFSNNVDNVFDEINYMAQDIHYSLGGFHTEITYQNAFVEELLIRKEQFSYFRELPMDIIYKDRKVGTGIPDFVIIPNAKYFNLNDELPAFFIEMKIKKRLENELYDDVIGEMKDNSKNKIGKSDSRQQLWKYLNSATFSDNPSIKKVDIGVIINFSTELETQTNPTPFITDEQGAYIEIWQMKTNKKQKFRNIEGQNEMHLILDTVSMPMTEKEFIKYEKEMFE